MHSIISDAGKRIFGAAMTEVIVEANLPTVYGDFKVKAFKSTFPDFPHLVLYNGEVDTMDAVYVRIHSECMTGDVFSSVRCDCGEQLTASLKFIGEKGGVLLYLRQEGRGIGLVNKFKAYNLQDGGLDTIEANKALGFHADERDYEVGLQILRTLRVKKIHLLTNNPDKLDVFENSGIEVMTRVPLEIAARPQNRKYLVTKKESMGHLFEGLDFQL